MKNGQLKVVGIGGTLRRALGTAGAAGAETELLDLRELNLPFYEPGRPIEEYGPEVRRFVETASRLRPEVEPEARVLRASA